MVNWIDVVGWISRGVLLLLAGLSVWSVAVMVERSRLFRELQAKGDDFEGAANLIRARNWSELAKWSSSQAGIRSGVLKAAMESGSRDPQSIDRAVRSFLANERSHLESGLTVLATLGSNAPFIGLFGTVLGIIQAFGVLADSQYSSTVVMKGISEALVATAVGLFVAIPAVVAYNVFSRQLRVLLTECDSLRDLYISRLKEEESRGMAGEVSGSSSEEMGPISAINVTPFVDVVLVLLVIFMVTAPALMKDTLGIRLPKASSASQSAPQSFGLAVNRMGQLLLNGQVATEEEVVAEARAQVSRNSGFQVIISADGEARHQSVVRAIDLVKSAGVTQFALQIQRQQQQAF